MDKYTLQQILHLLRELPMRCGQKTGWEHNSQKDTHIFASEKEKVFQIFHTEAISLLYFHQDMFQEFSLVSLSGTIKVCTNSFM